MSKLQMPPKGKSAQMLAELQAEHADADEPLSPTENPVTEVTGLARTQITEDTQSDGQVAQEPEAAPGPTDRDTRLRAATDRAAQDEIIVVTVRVAACLNRYMDDYVARRNMADPRTKYRKQDAVAEAFAAFYADHPMPVAPPPEDL